MAAYVKLNRPREMNGRSYAKGTVIHVPLCVARAMDRNGVGTKLKASEARAELAAKEKAREAKAAKADKKAAKAAKAAAPQ